MTAVPFTQPNVLVPAQRAERLSSIPTRHQGVDVAIETAAIIREHPYVDERSAALAALTTAVRTLHTSDWFV